MTLKVCTSTTSRLFDFKSSVMVYGRKTTTENDVFVQQIMALTVLSYHKGIYLVGDSLRCLVWLDIIQNIFIRYDSALHQLSLNHSRQHISDSCVMATMMSNWLLWSFCPPEPHSHKSLLPHRISSGISNRKTKKKKNNNWSHLIFEKLTRAITFKFVRVVLSHN